MRLGQEDRAVLHWDAIVFSDFVVGVDARILASAYVESQSKIT